MTIHLEKDPRYGVGDRELRASFFHRRTEGRHHARMGEKSGHPNWLNEA
jgi:hypothetical protein